VDNSSFEEAPGSLTVIALQSTRREDRIAAVRSIFEDMVRGLRQVIIGEGAAIHRSLYMLLSGQHALIVGVPGTAKTSLIETLATLCGLPSVYLAGVGDTLSSDWTGAEIPLTDSLALRELPPDERTVNLLGPLIGKSVVLVDEFNRSSALAQAALLRAMQDNKVVTTTGRSIALPRPFVVFAAMNPFDRGTQPLSDANAERFAGTIPIGPQEKQAWRDSSGSVSSSVSHSDMDTTTEHTSGLSRNDLIRLLGYHRAQRSHQDDHTVGRSALRPIISRADLIATQRIISDDVAVHPVVEGYIADLHNATDAHHLIGRPLGYRAPLALQALAQARAACSGRDAVTPDDVKALYSTVYCARFSDPSYRKIGVVAQDVLSSVSVPRSATGRDRDSRGDDRRHPERRY